MTTAERPHATPNRPRVRPTPAPNPRAKAEASVADLYALKEYTTASGASADGAEHLLCEELVRAVGQELLRGLGGDAAERVTSARARHVKRGFDLAVTVVSLIVFFPVLIVAAVWIRLTSPGPVFFLQERLGQNGRWFRAVKFRTMYVDAEARLQDMLAHDPARRVEYQKYHKLSNDPRVTKAGRFLRKHNLDELPQLLNIFRGEMSVVGPRAYLPFEVPDMADTERILVILQVKPGLTGFWQVAGRNKLSFDERLDMDVFYVQNWSLGMDLYIIINTAWLMLFASGYGAS